MRWSIIAISGLVACATPEERFCEERSRCLESAPPPFEFLNVSDDVDWCVERLEAAIPDKSSHLLDPCADCLEDTSCEAIKTGACWRDCKAARDAIGTPGSASGACDVAPTRVFASDQALEYFDQLTIEIDCEPPNDPVPTIERIVIVPGPDARDGVEQPCGRLITMETHGHREGCVNATGTISSVEHDGRRTYVGSCSCGDVTVDFEAPYRFFGWALTTNF